MVNAAFVTSLVLAFSTPPVDVVDPVLPAVDTCSSTEAAGQEYLKLSRLAISDQPRTTSQFVVENEQVADNPNRIPFIPRPALLTNVQHLIAGAIESIRADTEEVFVSSGTDTHWKSKVKAESTGEEILMQLGLYPVPTPATGNCQYYAVAMSLLGLRFDTVQHIEALEQLTRHLKEGIAQAIRHGYEVEFPHDIRQTILVSTQLDVSGQEITILRRRKNQIGFSRSTFVPLLTRRPQLLRSCRWSSGGRKLRFV